MCVCGGRHKTKVKRLTPSNNLIHTRLMKRYKFSACPPSEFDSEKGWSRADSGFPLSKAEKNQIIIGRVIPIAKCLAL